MTAISQLTAADGQDVRTILRVSELCVTYRLDRKTSIRAVDRASFDIRAGETLGLIGESGSGKTTLGQAVALLLPTDSGSIEFDGHDLRAASSSTLKKLRPRLQIVLQDPHASLDPRKTIGSSLIEPLRVQHRGSRESQRSRAKGALPEVGLDPSFVQRYPHELSGGQKQRVNIARSLMLDPDLVVCDEIVSALDVSLQADVLNLLQDIQANRSIALLFISHDLGVVAHVAHRIAVLYLGQMMEIGRTSDLLKRPMHPYTAALIAARPQPLPSTMQPENRSTLTGDIPSAADPPPGCLFSTRCPYVKAHCREVEPEWREVQPGRWTRCHYAEEMVLPGESVPTTEASLESSS